MLENIAANWISFLLVARTKRDHFQQQMNLATMEIPLIGSCIFRCIDDCAKLPRDRSNVTSWNFCAQSTKITRRATEPRIECFSGDFVLFLYSSSTWSGRETTFSRFIEQSRRGNVQLLFVSASLEREEDTLTILFFRKRAPLFISFFFCFIRVLKQIEKLRNNTSLEKLLISKVNWNIYIYIYILYIEYRNRKKSCRTLKEYNIGWSLKDWMVCKSYFFLNIIQSFSGHSVLLEINFCR